jgi:hypothetical protein
MNAIKWAVNANELKLQTISNRINHTSKLLQHGVACQERNLSIFQNTDSQQQPIRLLTWQSC